MLPELRSAVPVFTLNDPVVLAIDFPVDIATVVLETSSETD